LLTVQESPAYVVREETEIYQEKKKAKFTGK
jgi:hypothetical protein